MNIWTTINLAEASSMSLMTSQIDNKKCNTRRTFGVPRRISLPRGFEQAPSWPDLISRESIASSQPPTNCTSHIAIGFPSLFATMGAAPKEVANAARKCRRRRRVSRPTVWSTGRLPKSETSKYAQGRAKGGSV